MNRLAILLSALAFLFSVQCRHRVDYPADKSVYNEKSGESLEVRGKWMKYKGLKADIGLQIRNDYKHTIVLKNHEFHVEMDGDKGYLSSPRAATFEMEPGETISREMTFRFDKERDRKGPLKLIISKIQVGPMEKPGKALPDAILELPLQN
jgi:hypothetical protein